MFRINVVILYCIAWPYKLHLLKSFDCSEQSDLHISWKAIVHTIGVHHVSFKSLRFQPYLMRLLLWKSNYLLLNGWTVAGALALTFVTFKLGQKMPIFLNDLVSARVSSSQITVNEGMDGLESFELVYKTEGLDGII